MQPQIWLVLDTELPLSPTRTTSVISHTQSRLGDICQDMTAWDAIGCSDQSQYPIRICWQWWLTVVDSRWDFPQIVHRQVYDHAHQKASQATRRVKKPLLNVSTKVPSYYEKRSWVSWAAKRSAAYVVDLCFFLLLHHSLVPPSASHQYEIQFRFIANRSSQAPLKANTLD